MRPEDDIHLGERSFEFDLISQSNLLKKSLGTKVLMKFSNSDGYGASPERIEGTLASVPQRDLWTPFPTAGTRKLYKLKWSEIIRKESPFHYRLAKAEPNVLVQTSEGLSQARPGEVALSGMPGGLRAHPTLLQDLESPIGGPRDLELAYLTQGLTWSARYVATLDSNLQHMDLDCFVTIANNSGVTFERATLSLLAGEVNRVADSSPFKEEGDNFGMVDTTVVVTASAAFREQQLLDYHLFTWSAPTTLKQSQQKQLSLFSAQRIPLDPVIQVAVGLDANDGSVEGSEQGEDIPVLVSAKFKNTVASNLGRPIPYGVVAAVYRTPEGSALPLPEENSIDSVSKGEDATLNLGLAHGLSAKLTPLEIRKETKWEIIQRIKWPVAKVFLQSVFTRKTFDEAAEPYDGIDGSKTIATYRLDLINYLARPKQIELLIQMLEGMRLLRADAPHTKQDATSEIAKVTLPPHSQTSLTLQVWRPN